MLRLFVIVLLLNAGLLLSYGTVTTLPVEKSILHSHPRDTIKPGSGEDFYDSLKVRAHKQRWSRELYNIIVVPARDSSDTIKTSLSKIQYERFEGLIIKDIYFVKLNPFGTDINDTSFYNSTRWNNLANTVHVKTRDPVLERHLIISEKEVIDPRVIADNERLIRDLPFIEDVRILIIPDSITYTHAEVVIITQDRWSKAFFPEIKNVDAGKLEMWDRSIFGTGQEVQFNLHWDRQRSRFFGYEAFYSNKNILGSFIDSKISYKNLFDAGYYGINLERRFYTPDIRYAGGINMYNSTGIEKVWFSDTLRREEDIHNQTADFWIARSFRIREQADYLPRRMNITLGTRYFRTSFTQRPIETERKVFPEYHSRTLWLNSLSFSSQSFYRSKLIYSYGQTEDIPIGWLANLSLGREFSEFEDRWYTSLRLSHGDFILNLGYFHASAAAGSYITRENELQQGILQFRVNHFSNLYVLRNLKHRYFVYLDYTRGLNRFTTERLDISDKNGIRGLNLQSFNGQQKISMKLESVIFTPRTYLGFQFAYFGFADFAFIGKDKVALKDMDAFTGIGVGLRLRNERLVFPTIQFRFAYYPNVEGLNLTDYFEFSGEKKLRPPDFSPGKPEIIDFR